MADLAVLEKIKAVDDSHTWPHPTEKKSIIHALYIRDENNKAFMLLCPIASFEKFPYNTSHLEKYVNNFSQLSLYSKRIEITKEILEYCDEPSFYILPIGELIFEKISKEEVERILGTVVD